MSIKWSGSMVLIHDDVILKCCFYLINIFHLNNLNGNRVSDI